MYFPYFRGKQFELIAIRESAELLHKSRFKPVIEPVRQDFKVLYKTLDEIVKFDGSTIVIANPDSGNFNSSQNFIAEDIVNKYSGCNNISFGLLLKENLTRSHIDSMLKLGGTDLTCLIHAGISDANLLKDLLGEDLGSFYHLFLEDQSGKLYRRHFNDSGRVLLRDGFRRLNNRDYSNQEFFSDLHATFEDEGMKGFGDFLTIGNYFSDTGGPAYAVAIHLTYIDRDKDDEMHIRHFKSIRQDDPKDPAGKFLEALTELVEEVQVQSSQMLNSSAIKEFLYLHERGHFPGLGYVKKLSIKHHIETLANYFQSRK